MSSDNNCNVYFKSFRLKSSFLGLRRQFLVTEIPFKKIKNESAKLCASRAFILYVPHMPTSLTCLRALRAHVPACFPFFYVHYVPSFSTYLVCLHFFKYFQFLACLTCFHLCHKMWNKPETIATGQNKKQRGRINQK